MRYQKVLTQIWHDEKFQELSERGQRLFLYLLTSPHSNLIGTYVVKPGYSCEDLKWSKEVLNKGLIEVLTEGMISYDKLTGVVFIKKYLCHNPITNPNQLKAAKKIVKSLPKTFILQELKELVEVLPEGLTKGLLEVLGEGILYTVPAPVGSLSVKSKQVKEGNSSKKRYGNFVMLTAVEHKSLTKDLTKPVLGEYIDKINEYIGSSGKSYKSHYYTILSWVRRDNERAKEGGITEGYDPDYWENKGETERKNKEGGTAS